MNKGIIIILLLTLQATVVLSQQQFTLPNQGETIVLKSDSKKSDFLAADPGRQFILKLEVLKGKASFSVSICLYIEAIEAGKTYNFVVDSTYIGIKDNKFFHVFSKICRSNKDIVIILEKDSEVALTMISLDNIPLENRNQPPELPKIYHNDSIYKVILNQEEIEEFRNDHLEEQNRRRKVHDANPLVVNDNLQQYAQFYSEYLVKAKGCEAESKKSSHSPKALFTESIAIDIEGYRLFGIKYWTWLKNSYDRFGENILSVEILGGSCDGKSFNDYYYNEIEEYVKANPNYSPDHNSGEGGHFTQEVWKGSKEIGIGLAKCYNKRTQTYLCYSVSSYYPHGNALKTFSNNVALPKGAELEEILNEVRERKRQQNEFEEKYKKESSFLNLDY